jgi:molecular chaperone GrpE
MIKKKMPDRLKEDDNVKGLLLLENQMLDFLKNQGVEEVKALNEKFDPDLMEAAEIIEEKNKDSGTVIEEVQKGYKINGRLLRPAKVKVIK